jgi:hypothetical protein
MRALLRERLKKLRIESGLMSLINHILA